MRVALEWFVGRDDDPGSRDRGCDHDVRVALGCTVLELTMSAIRHSLGEMSHSPYDRLVPSVSLKSEDR